MQVLAAWAIWLSWLAVAALFGRWLPGALAGLLFIGVPLLSCVLIFLGQKRLPLRANIPLLIVQGAAALYATSFVMLIYAASTVPSRYFACERPSLETNILSVRDEYARHVLSDACPAPIPSKMEFEREYGVIKALWVGGMSSGTPSSPSGHDSLYISARLTSGTPLRISGARVEDYGGRIPEFLARYSSRVIFDGRPETFTIEVSRKSGELIEQVEFEYLRRQCSCQEGAI